MNVSANNNVDISENSNITVWIIIYIALCIAVLCTQLFALILLKKDHNFRTNQKYLIGALCCTIVTRKEIVWIHGPFTKNFRNMSTIAGWSFTKGTDLFRGAPGCR